MIHAWRRIFIAFVSALPLAAAFHPAFAQSPNLAPPAINPQPQVPLSQNVPTPAQTMSVPEGDIFTLGDPLKDLGQTLKDDGIYLKGFLEDTLYGLAGGGNERGTVAYHELFYGLDADLSRSLGLKGTVVHLSFDTRFGGFPQGVNNFDGSGLGYLQGAGPTNNTRLNEFDLDQHAFDDRVRVIVGRTTLANYFGASFAYCQFQISVCSNLSPFNWSANSDAPFWPIATWAGEIAFWPTPFLYARVGASADDVYHYNHGGFPWDGGWSTSHATGAFVPAEIGYLTTPFDERYARQYDIGFFYDSTDFPDQRYNSAGGLLAQAGGTPLDDGARIGVYAQFSQIVWRPSASSDRNLTILGGVQFDAGTHAPYQAYYQLGAIMNGPFEHRPHDSAGLLAIVSIQNRRVVEALNDLIAVSGGAGQVSGSQAIFEANYGWALAPGVQIKPYADLILHPDQNLFDITPDPNVHTAFAAGAQFSLLFNDAFGLPSWFRPN